MNDKTLTDRLSCLQYNYRITQAAETLFKTLPLPANATIKQSEKNIGAVATCPSEIADQTVNAMSVDSKIEVHIDTGLGKHQSEDIESSVQRPVQ